MVLVVSAVGLVVGCGNKNKTTEIIEKKDTVAVPKTIQRMQDYKSSGAVSLHGTKYTYDIHRMSDSGLPTVSDESGKKYYDNKIDLTITKDGSQFFTKTFSKETFSSYIDEEFKKKGVLEGLVFDKTDGDCLQFAASVSYPQIESDEYIPLIVRVSKDGSISISRDSQMDTSGKSDEEE